MYFSSKSAYVGKVGSRKEASVLDDDGQEVIYDDDDMNNGAVSVDDEVRVYVCK